MWREIYHEFRRWAKTSGGNWVALKRTEITVETDRVWVIRKSRTNKLWCPVCGREVGMVGLAEAEALTGLNGPALRAYAEAHSWHVFRGEDGGGLICLESWLKSE